MKTINQYKDTDKFCITGTHVGHLAAISEKYGRTLIAVAYDEEQDGTFVYCVRLLEPTGLRDALVDVRGDNSIIEMESTPIMARA